MDDYGGPYREVFTQIATELTATTVPSPHRRIESTTDTKWRQCEPVLPLLKPSTFSLEQEDGTCCGADFFVPANVSIPRLLSMYKFLGQLIGIGIRCQVAAPWKLSRVFWKGLVGERLKEQDLAHIDSAAHASVQELRRRIASREGFHGNDHHYTLQFDNEDMATTSAEEDLNGTTLNSEQPVDFRFGEQHVIKKFPDLPNHLQDVVQTRLHEGDTAMFAVRDGLVSVLPAALLPIFTWKEMEVLACGRPGVDVDLLQANTEYDDDISESDAHIQSFWRVLRAFNDRDRSQFLRFVWARSRLPTSTADFHQKFKIHGPTHEGAKENPDIYLPKAHTCFFSINLPRYSSDNVMAKKLTYTMYNCIEMDADFRLADNETSAGWLSTVDHAGGDNAVDRGLTPR